MQRGARRVIAIHKCSVVLNIQMKSGCAWMFVSYYVAATSSPAAAAKCYVVCYIGKPISNVLLKARRVRTLDGR